MAKSDRYPPWYNEKIDPSRLLAAMDELRHLCTNANEVMPHARRPGSLMHIDAIKKAIDDWAESETGHREFFWGKPHSAGCKHS